MASSAAILLSRQALRPSRKNNWVNQSIEAVKWLKENELTLCTSTGMQTWELLTALGSMYQLNLKLYLPLDKVSNLAREKEFLIAQFKLNSNKTEFIPIYNKQVTLSKRELMFLRDEKIINHADVLLPVSIRERGQLETLLSQYSVTSKKIITKFRTEYESRQKPLSYKIPINQLNPEIHDIAQKYLIHWTRTFNSPWATEKLIDYYRAVIESDCYPRSAFDSLLNIITLKLIKASSKNIPSKTPVVSFSKQNSTEMVNLIKWRARYKQMSFEPYGIGIEKELSEKLGIFPVKYYKKVGNGYDKTDNNQPWLRQSEGVKTDWKIEQEYRHHGDLNLSDIPLNKMILICHTEEEAKRISNHTGIRAISFISGVVST